jgi:hypothetical protein
MDEKALGAAAIVGMAIWEIAKTYNNNAPSLSSLRNAPFDTASRQQLLDADMMVGGLAFLAGVTGSWLAKSWIPLLVVVAAFAWMCCYHHMVLKGPTCNDL